jgi:hypothetical protein
MADWQTLFERLIAVVFCCVGLWLLVRGFARLCFTNPELAWKPVAGVIQESCVGKNDDGDGTTYEAKLQYGYHYGGINFIGNRIAPLQVWSSLRWTAESFARKYPRGREVTVYVDPRNPGKSVLEPGRQIVAALCLGLMGVAFITIAWLSTWMT